MINLNLVDYKDPESLSFILGLVLISSAIVLTSATCETYKLLFFGLGIGLCVLSIVLTAKRRKKKEDTPPAFISTKYMAKELNPFE